jgi:beta-phosphoglucomutase-like phosphatase (HAD superfamily)
MKLNYRCLVLDHDDTVVDSSATVHFPAYLETMRTLRPAMVPVTLDGWFLKNFDPGILPYLTDELGFSAEELETEYRIWRSYSSVREPHFYPGMAELLTTYASEGGRIAVVSHSERDIIERDYRSAGGVMPELVFGWEMDQDKRKPSPWPVLEALRVFGAAPEDILVVDDLKPAVVMARSAGVAVAGAGWGHSIPEIVEFMKQNCDHYFPRLVDLEKTLFS